MDSLKRIDRYILRNGIVEPCTHLEEWAAWFENNRNERIIKQEMIGESKVSTVFLSIDHNWEEGGPPLLFETMVFGGPLDQETERYSTLAEAKLGHEAMADRVRKAT